MCVPALLSVPRPSPSLALPLLLLFLLGQLLIRGVPLGDAATFHGGRSTGALLLRSESSLARRARLKAGSRNGNQAIRATTTTTSAPHFLKPHLCGGRQATQRVACLAFSGSSVLAPPFFFFLFLRPARLYRGRACSVPLCHVARGSRLTIRCRRRRQRASASESPGGGSPAHGAERTPRAHARARAYSGRPGPRRRERSRRLPLT